MATLDELIGRRVALRRRVPGPQGRELLSDAVGELAEGQLPTEVAVHTRAGVVTVPRASVVAVREIPPAQPRRPSWAAVTRLEGICADAWPAQVNRPLGQWRLRAAGGFTGRANSALAVGDPGIPVPDALERVLRFAEEHGIPPLLQVPTDSPWQRAATGQGWQRHARHEAGALVSVLVGPVAGLATPPRPDQPVITITERPGPEWWRVCGEEPITEGQRHVLGAELPEVGYGLVTVDGAAAGGVRLVALDEHVYVSRLAVLPQHRRRGLAVALMDAAASWAVGRGVRWCVLQVSEENAPALRLYRQLGMRLHHRYEYLRPPG